ncbi:MAG: hypothetical protein DMG72_20075 [Acidobacteria bacterium]|nr:MAG: hypothetical protein DMG96_09895 [Acidobacteriota bacterium]PYX69762.1 MAG: hypothetical protein DMG72_20075 [Acidobacteriota bacterium]
MLQFLGGENARTTRRRPVLASPYYDFNVWSEHKFVEKLGYIQRNQFNGNWSSVPRIGLGAVFVTT